MLIGPTLTLKRLEEKIEKNINGHKMKLNDLSKTFKSLQLELEDTPKGKKDEKGDMIPNPRHNEIKNEIKEIEEKIKEINKNIDFMNEKLDELENIEKTSGGKINKAKDTITLTLNDCLRMGITTKELQEEDVRDEEGAKA